MDSTGGGTSGPAVGPEGATGSGGGAEAGSETAPAAGGPRAVDWSGRPAWFILNETAAFLVELAAFAALCWWGLHVGGALLAVVTPLAAMVVWGLLASPRARFTLPVAAVLAVKAVILGGGAVALWPLGHPVWAIVLGAVVLVNTGILETARRRPPAPAPSPA